MNLSAPFPNPNKACWGCSCIAAAGARLCRSPGGFANSKTLISSCGTDSYEAGPESGSAWVLILCCNRHTNSSYSFTGPALTFPASIGPLYMTQNWPKSAVNMISVLTRIEHLTVKIQNAQFEWILYILQSAQQKYYVYAIAAVSISMLLQLYKCVAILPIYFVPEESALRNSLSHSHSLGCSTDILFPGNGATCRSVLGPIRTVSEGNADRAGVDVGGWWCWASVTGTSIRALSFPPVLLSAMGTHTELGTDTGQGTNTCQKILSLWSEWVEPELTLPWHLDCNVKAAEDVREKDHRISRLTTSFSPIC